MAIWVGQNFTIRENTYTVITGKITKLLPSVEVPKKMLNRVDFSRVIDR